MVRSDFAHTIHAKRPVFSADVEALIWLCVWLAVDVNEVGELLSATAAEVELVASSLDYDLLFQGLDLLAFVLILFSHLRGLSCWI